MALSSFFSSLLSLSWAGGAKAEPLFDWSKLPDDLKIDILCRLPEKPLVRAKCVSKSWNVLISSFCVPKIYPPTYLAGLLCKWTSLPYNSTKYDMDYYPCAGHSHEFPPDPDNCGWFLKSYNGLLQFEGTTGNDVEDNCNGLLLLAKEVQKGGRYFVCNPATKQCVAVPVNPCRRIVAWTAAALAFDPSVFPDYTIVHFDCEQRRGDTVCLSNPPRFDLFSSYTGKWVTHMVPLDLDVYGFKWCASRVFLDGVLYMLSMSGYLLHFDLNLKDKSLQARTFRLPDFNGVRAGFIGVSEGRLFYSDCDPSYIRLWSFTDNCGDSLWTLKYDICIDDLTRCHGEWILNSDNGSQTMKIHALDPTSDVIFIGTSRTLYSYHPKSKQLEVFCNFQDKRKTKGLKYLVFPYAPREFFLDNFKPEHLY